MQQNVRFRGLRRAIVGAGIALVAAGGLATAAAQSDGLDPVQVALAYHKLSGEPLDLQRVAEASETVRRASGFDRPDAIKAEVARLQALLAGVADQEFLTRVNDGISQYDHERGEFSIMLFTPGYYLPVQAFGQEYQVVFANADGSRAIAMAKEEARDFDTRLGAIGRRVINEIRFRVTGKGDPAGAVTGQRVVRAEIVSVRLLDQSGNVVLTPRVVASAAAGGASAGASGGGPAAAVFDLATADVAGFRVGVKGKDLEATLSRLFGPVTRGSPGPKAFAGFKGTLTVNEMGCFSVYGRQRPEPGAVCVTAFLDGGDVVRSIRIERLFPWLQAEVFRAVLVGKYGPVAGAQSGRGYVLGWGPELDASLGSSHALTASYETNDDYISRGGNALPQIRVVLQLVDAAWTTRQSR